MILKKYLSVLMIFSQLAFVNAYGGDSTAVESSPEVKLFSGVIALSGENLPKELLQKEVTEKLDQYNAAAPMQGRTERTAQALVSLGVETPEQAQALMAKAATFANTKFSSAQDAQKAFQAIVLQQVASTQGAQFSYCDGGGSALFAVVGLAVLSGGIVMFQGSDLTESVWGSLVATLGIAVIGGTVILGEIPGCGD